MRTTSLTDSSPWNHPENNRTKMLIGSSDAVKVWLNGELVHYNFVDRYSSDYQDQAPVTLKTGVNILLVCRLQFSTAAGADFSGSRHDAEYTCPYTWGPAFLSPTDTTRIPNRYRIRHPSQCRKYERLSRMADRYPL